VRENAVSGETIAGLNRRERLANNQRTKRRTALTGEAGIPPHPHIGNQPFDWYAFRNGGNMKPRISMITLGVSDMETSIRFYQEGLGFPRVESSPEVAFFSLNGTWLGLYSRESLAEDAAVSPDGSGFPGFTLSHNVASESEVDLTIEQAVSAGATLVKPPLKVFWGGYSGYFKDPDGNLWEVAHNPHFWVGPEDDNSYDHHRSRP
jgi:catechol 2,3-dioxygenase-like lactoylglutathione lyase family enzyme